MIHVLIPFEVKEKSLTNALNVISIFVKKVNANEPDTILYKSLQNEKDPTKFVHLMSFKNEIAQEHHRSTTYCKEFVEALYPMCSLLPKPNSYKEVN